MIEQILGKRRQDLSIADVDVLIANRAKESQRLEFKREPPEKTDDARRSFVRDVVAMCNGGGGLILYGLGEDAGHCASINPFSLKGERERLQQILSTSTQPPIRPDFVALANPDGTGILVVEVRPSSLFPHAALTGSRLEYVIRSNATTRQMIEPEIERAYRQRWTKEADVIQSAARLRDQVAGSSSSIWMVAIPLEASGPAFRVSQAVLQRMRDLAAECSHNGILGEPTLHLNPTVQFRRLEFREYEPPREDRILFSDNGSFAGSRCMPRHRTRMDSTPPAVLDLASITPFFLFSAVCNLLLSFRVLAESFSMSGQCLYSVGINIPERTLFLDDNARHHSAMIDSDQSQVVQTLDLSTLSTGMGLLGAAKDPLDHLLTVFGRAEACIIDRESQISWGYVPQEYRRTASAWAVRHGLRPCPGM